MCFRHNGVTGYKTRKLMPIFFIFYKEDLTNYEPLSLITAAETPKQ